MRIAVELSGRHRRDGAHHRRLRGGRRPDGGTVVAGPHHGPAAVRHQPRPRRHAPRHPDPGAHGHGASGRHAAGEPGAHRR
ncbi:hypothetical protein G6F35_017880 [Rhizopus arrhizus]|nr:hypothetical protein G6F35_017880 [Rhizopus arrhizus]